MVCSHTSPGTTMQVLGIVKVTRNKFNTNRKVNEVFQQLPGEMQQEIQQITQYHHPTTTHKECNHQL
jgi:hypothetical protein